MIYYTGVDLHPTLICLKTFDESGVSKSELQMGTEESDVLEYFQSIEQDFSKHRVVVESTSNWYWFSDLLKDHGIELSLAHTGRLEAIKSSKVKTDQRDAETLAQLLRIGYIPEAHMISVELRSLRDLMRNRLDLVHLRVSQINRIHAELYKYNIHKDIDGIIDLINTDHLETLAPAVQLQINQHLDQIKFLEQQTKESELFLDKELKAFKNKEYKQILTIPGIGIILGATILLESGDMKRFPEHGKYLSYANLVPKAENSNRTKKQKTSKQGNKYLKRAYKEAAVHAIRSYPVISEFYKRKKRKSGKRIALTIVAVELAKAFYYMYLKDENFKAFKGIKLK